MSEPTGPDVPADAGEPAVQPVLGERRRRRQAERSGQVDLDGTMSHWPVVEPPSSPRPVVRPARPSLPDVATAPVVPTPSALVVAPLLAARQPVGGPGRGQEDGDKDAGRSRRRGAGTAAQTAAPGAAAAAGPAAAPGPAEPEPEPEPHLDRQVGAGGTDPQAHGRTALGGPSGGGGGRGQAVLRRLSSRRGLVAAAAALLVLVLLVTLLVGLLGGDGYIPLDFARPTDENPTQSTTPTPGDAP